MPNSLQKIAIIGGGIWGLHLAYRIKNYTTPVIYPVVFEAKKNPGGVISTRQVGGCLMESGPNGFLDSNPITFNLCKTLGLVNELLPASESSKRNRFLFHKNQLFQLPSSIWGMASTSVISWQAKWRIITESFLSRRNIPDDESISDFFRARFGNEIAEGLADAFVTGIWAGDPELLSLPSCFPRWRAFESEFGSLLRGLRIRKKKLAVRSAKLGLPPPNSPQMWSLNNGLGDLIDCLRYNLRDSLRVSSRVSSLRPVNKSGSTFWELKIEDGSIELFDQVVLACPSWEQAKIVKSFDPNLSGALGSIPYTSIAVVALSFNSSSIKDVKFPLNGFGYLTPQRDGRPILGVQWCSSIFPNRRSGVGTSLWRALVGGPGREDLLELSDNQLSKLVLNELATVGGWNISPINLEIFRWPKAIPQYMVGHKLVVEKAVKLSRAWPGLHIGGSALQGVALNDCVEQSGKLAAILLNFSKSTQE